MDWLHHTSAHAGPFELWSFVHAVLSTKPYFNFIIIVDWLIVVFISYCKIYIWKKSDTNCISTTTNQSLHVYACIIIGLLSKVLTDLRWGGSGKQHVYSEIRMYVCCLTVHLHKRGWGDYSIIKDTSQDLILPPWIWKDPSMLPFTIKRQYLLPFQASRYFSEQYTTW